MGFYITCQYCGQTEKSTHPNCGCIQRARDKLLKKTTESTVVSQQISETDEVTCLYTCYEKNGEKFWVCTVIKDPFNMVYETVTEVPTPETD